MRRDASATLHTWLHPFRLSLLQPPPSSPFRAKKTHPRSEPMKACKARQMVSSHLDFPKQTHSVEKKKKKKKSPFPLRHCGKASLGDCHDPPESGSSQVEPRSAWSPPSTPVLRTPCPPVTFPARPTPELPANKSFHAGRHTHPAEPRVNFPLPFGFAHFFSAETNKTQREPSDSK